jgi:3-methylcrotonyl-CoA carboxylase alpha subunit
MFDKILIANRGEIACRIIRTCRRLGIATVAIYSEADASALHVRLADEAYCVGPAAARESYLVGERVIAIAKESGAQAIHPGYGFLSESPEFAQRTLDAGLVFIGPSPQSMRSMSSKATARDLMQRVGVPVLPGYQGAQQDAAHLRGEAKRMGYPVLIKAVSGGGGKGMRQVHREADFDAALLACQREAAASFSDARVLLERYIKNPRHIEVQVFGDAAGRVIHLYERDCSAQRRHQKVIEESPAPGLSADQRQALTTAACEAARAVGYSSAGTVEFLFDEDGQFYFIEMNTRIQVEHPVTEMITGLDLVEWQLRVAAGQPLPLTQEQIRQQGHAIEARLYAEVPESGFLPSSGVLRRFELPAATRVVRLETGIEAGDRVGTDYDPMLAKVITYGATRTEALTALQRALAQVRVLGLGCNVLFLRRLLASAAFRAGRIDTGYIERELAQFVKTAAAGGRRETILLVGAALWILAHERSPIQSVRAVPGDPIASEPPSPWQDTDGWRLNGWLKRRLRFEWIPTGVTTMSGPGEGAGALGQANEMESKRLGEVEIEYRPHGLWVRVGSEEGEGALNSLGQDDYEVRYANRAEQLQIIDESPGQLLLWRQQEAYRLRQEDPLAVLDRPQEADRSLAAPMPGRLIAQLVRAGEQVRKGTPLLIIEAMKMEHTLCAPSDGTVRQYRATIGDQIIEGQELVEFDSTQ